MAKKRNPNTRTKTRRKNNKNTTGRVRTPKKREKTEGRGNKKIRRTNPKPGRKTPDRKGGLRGGPKKERGTREEHDRIRGNKRDKSWCVGKRKESVN